jgi:hypothetical protein
MQKKKVYINVTYLEYMEYPIDTPDEVIEKEIKEWIENVHPDHSDRDWDILESED